MTGRRMTCCTYLFFWGCLLISSCSDTAPPRGELVDFSGKAGSQTSGVEFTVPEGWVQEQPSSGMRQWQYRLPGPPPLGGDAEVAVFVGIGGTAEQNVERWLGQFRTEEPPQVTKQRIDDFLVTLVEVRGIYAAGMMNPKGPADAVPKGVYRMLAAVIETRTQPWFVKLVGPEDTVTKWEGSFRKFVESAR